MARVYSFKGHWITNQDGNPCRWGPNMIDEVDKDGYLKMKLWGSLRMIAEEIIHRERNAGGGGEQLNRELH